MRLPVFVKPWIFRALLENNELMYIVFSKYV